MLQTCISKEDIHHVQDRSLEFLASGITSAIGEQCLTNAGALGVFPEPCLEAIAAGDGREIMKFDADIARMHGIRVSVASVGSLLHVPASKENLSFAPCDHILKVFLRMGKSLA